MPIEPIWTWTQTEAAVSVEIQLPKGTNPREIEVDVLPHLLRVYLVSPYLLLVDLYTEVDGDSAQCRVRDKKLFISIQKKEPGIWPTLAAPVAREREGELRAAVEKAIVEKQAEKKESDSRETEGKHRAYDQHAKERGVAQSYRAAAVREALASSNSPRETHEQAVVTGPVSIPPPRRFTAACAPAHQKKGNNSFPSREKVHAELMDEARKAETKLLLQKAAAAKQRADYRLCGSVLREAAHVERTVNSDLAVSLLGLSAVAFLQDRAWQEAYDATSEGIELETRPGNHTTLRSRLATLYTRQMAALVGLGRLQPALTAARIAQATDETSVDQRDIDAISSALHQ